MGVTIFIFGCVNFAILIALMIFGGRRVAKQFFYARQMQIKKEMIDAATLLRSSKKTFFKNKKMADDLSTEIVLRTTIAKERNNAQCEKSIESAERHAARIIENARNQAEGDRRRAMMEIKSQIVSKAFSLAENKIIGSLDEKTKMAMSDRAIGNLAKIITKSSGEGRWKNA